MAALAPYLKLKLWRPVQAVSVKTVGASADYNSLHSLTLRNLQLTKLHTPPCKPPLPITCNMDQQSVIVTRSISNNRNNNGESELCLNHSEKEQKKKVVIFDKDGTLTCMNAMWAPWIICTAKKLEDATGLVLRDEVYRTMAFDLDARVFGPGPLTESTNEECIRHLCKLLERGGVPVDRADRITRECYEDGSAMNTGELKAFGDVHSIFTRLRGAGFYIAVNTSDSRVITEHTLNELGVSHLVDVVVCGNDAGIRPKPDAFTALKICEQLGVEPSNSIFIGDTPTDAMCGRNAKCGQVITVLTGGVDRQLLEDKADCVVDSIAEAADLILSRQS